MTQVLEFSQISLSQLLSLKITPIQVWIQKSLAMQIP